MSIPIRLAVALTFALATTSACDDQHFRLAELGSIEASPEAVVFVLDTVAVGERITQRVILRNVDRAAVAVTAMRLEDVTAAGGALLPVVVAIDAPSPTPFEVAPDNLGGVPIVLSYRRTDDLPRELNLVVTSTDLRRPKLNVAISVVRAASQLTASPSPVVFTDVGDGGAEQSLRLINHGLMPQSIHSIRVADEAAFSVILGGQTIESSANLIALEPPLVIAAHSAITAHVRFAPNEARVHDGRLLLFGDGANTSDGFEVKLLGSAVGPCLVANPRRIDFGRKAPDSVSIIGVEIENCGDTPIDIDEIRLSSTADTADTQLREFGVLGASSDRFALLFGAADPAISAADGRGRVFLAPGEIVELPVRYAAGPEEPVSVAGEATSERGYIIVRSNARAVAQVVALAGTTDRGPEPPLPDPVFPVVPGCELESATGRVHDVQIKIAGDDDYNAWLDGQDLPPRVRPFWHSVGTYNRRLVAGCYTLAIEVWDTGWVVSGLIASVTVDGVVRSVSRANAPEWIVSGPGRPPENWFSLDFLPDPDVWKSPSQCDPSVTSAWGSRPASILADGARWIWWTSDCQTLTRGFFRLTFTVD